MKNKRIKKAEVLFTILNSNVLMFLCSYALTSIIQTL
jgi:hypothetical protein